MKIVPFSFFSDYSKEALPSALYDPDLRNAFAAINNADSKQDFSFRVEDESGSLAYCLLYHDVAKQPPVFWALGAPATFWFTEKCPVEKKKKVAKLAVAEIKKCLFNSPQSIVSYAEYFVENELLIPTMHLMLEYSCASSLAFSHKIALYHSEELLRSNLRDRYKSLINKGIREFSFVTISKANVSENDIEKLHKCHIVASGRDVYTESFWGVWQKEIETGRAFMTLAEQSGQITGGCLCTISTDTMYYAIGAFDRELTHSGLSHACLWRSIAFAKSQGMAFFEMGRTDFACLKPDVSDKEMTIGFFKRGFGGSNAPVLYLIATIDNSA